MNVSRRMAETHVLEPLLSYAIDEVLQLVGAERGYIVLVETDGQLDFKVMRRHDGTDIPQGHDVISVSILEEVIRTGCSLVLANAMADPRFAGASSVMALQLRSVMCAPLIIQNKTIGAIYVENRAVNGRFAKTDIAPLELFANQAAASVQNARLHHEMQQEIQERRETQARNQALISQLEQKNAALEQFAYTISHELRTPLITITSFLGYLEKDYQLDDQSRLETDMFYIRQATTRMHDIMSALGSILEIDRLHNKKVCVSLQEIVARALTAVKEPLSDKNIQVLVSHQLPDIYADKNRIVLVIRHLLGNAVKFMGEQPAPTIEIGMAETEKGQALFVRDNGIGILPKYHERVFGLFEQLDPSVAGTGIGLSLCRRIVESHNGRIWLNAAEQKGTTVYLTLPFCT